jgi:hypothetical protein
VAVRTQYHFSAAGELFARVAMDDAKVGGHIDATIFFRGGKAKDVVVLVDGSADGAEAVVAIGHGVRHGELGESARPRGLYDADIGDVVRNQRVKSEAHLLHIAGGVVRAEDGIGNGFLARGSVRLGCGARLSVFERDRMVVIANHRVLLDRINRAFPFGKQAGNFPLIDCIMPRASRKVETVAYCLYIGEKIYNSSHAPL